jgi:carboxyl-terminal processing protease
VGLKTFGKGNVSLLKGLEDGGGLYYTYARWYTPKGRQIDGHGLEPDIEVTQLAGRPGDRQLEKALETLRTQAGVPTSS